MIVKVKGCRWCDASKDRCLETGSCGQVHELLLPRNLSFMLRLRHSSLVCHTLTSGISGRVVVSDVWMSSFTLHVSRVALGRVHTACPIRGAKACSFLIPVLGLPFPHLPHPRGHQSQRALRPRDRASFTVPR